LSAAFFSHIISYLDDAQFLDRYVRFKLHIRPKLRGADSKEDESIAKIPPLPSDKSAVEIASDFFRYLFECTKAYIQESHGNGDAVWASVEKDIDFVVSHPNGWGGYQQSQLREALVMAGLVEEWEGKTNGDKRVSFITEGEAGLHFALRHGLPKATMEVSVTRSLAHFRNAASLICVGSKERASSSSMAAAVLSISARIESRSSVTNSRR
jgi:hypothetical protein